MVRCFLLVAIMISALAIPAVAQDDEVAVDMRVAKVGVYQVPRYHHSSYVYAVVVNEGNDTLCGFEMLLTSTLNRCVVRERVEQCLAPGDTLRVVYGTQVVPEDESLTMVTITASVAVADDGNERNDSKSADYVLLAADDDISAEQMLAPEGVETIGDTVAVAVRLCNMGDYAVTEVPLAINYNNQFYDTVVADMLSAVGIAGLTAGQCVDYTTPLFYRVTVGYTTVEVIALAPYDVDHSNDTLFVLFTSETGFEGVDDVEGYLPDMALYPNPATDKIRIAFGTVAPVASDVLIVDDYGRVVRRRRIAAGADGCTIDIGDLAAGRYHVVVESAGRCLSRPLVVVR